MTSLQDVHIGLSSCLLCRQSAVIGAYILDLNRNLLKVPECNKLCAGCCYYPYPSVWLHGLCYKVFKASFEANLEPTMPELQEFADASRLIYDDLQELGGHRKISSILEGLFSNHTEKILRNCFRQDLLVQLPAEVTIMIARLTAPCWYLTVLGETRWSFELWRMIGPQKQCANLNLTNDIWVYTTRYRGISYVTRLSSEPLKVSRALDERCKKLPSTLKQIVLSMDCIGIRRIQWLDQKSHPVADGSPWYKILEVPDSETRIQVECRGIFVRDVDLVSEESSSALCDIWSSPFPPRIRSENSLLSRVKPRLDYIKLNSSIKGLLVCCSNGMNIGIHGFSSVARQFTDFVSLMHRRVEDSPKHWIYFPLNDHESVKAAWVRKFEFGEGSASCPVLILHTSMGRTITFGPQVPARILEHYEYHQLVQKDDNTVTGIYHDGLDPDSKYITEFGVTCDTSYGDEKSICLPTDIHLEPPQVPARRGSASKTWYMTKASLKGLVKVRLCRDKEQLHCPCLGLLLTYDDEHVESLGQVRWDFDMTQEVKRPVCVQIDTINGRDYVKNILSDEKEGYESGEMVGWLLMLPKYDTIVWWFSHIGDTITLQQHQK